MEKIYKMINNKKGFTLVELVVVIAIIGILAAVAIPKFTGVQKDARDKADLATIQTINNAIELYCAKENKETLVGATCGAGADLITIADGTSALNTIKVLEAEGYLKSGTKLNTPGALAYEVDTNKVQ